MRAKINISETSECSCGRNKMNLLAYTGRVSSIYIQRELMSLHAYIQVDARRSAKKKNGKSLEINISNAKNTRLINMYVFV